MKIGKSSQLTVRFISNCFVYFFIQSINFARGHIPQPQCICITKSRRRVVTKSHKLLPWTNYKVTLGLLSSARQKVAFLPLSVSFLRKTYAA